MFSMVDYCFIDVDDSLACMEGLNEIPSSNYLCSLHRGSLWMGIIALMSR